MQPVDTVADEAQDRRQQSEGGDDGDDPDEDRARGEAAHDRRLDEQEPQHGQDEGAAAEEDGAARGRPGRGDRVDLLLPYRPLLAEARDDEEGVVDPECEPHAREHVHDEDRELEPGRQDGDEAEPDRDRHEGQDQRQGGGDERAEHEDEHHQRGRQPELELALLEVVLRDLVEIGVGGESAGHRHLEAALAVLGADDLDHPFHALLGVACQPDRDEDGVPVGRDLRLPDVVDEGGGEGHLGQLVEPPVERGVAAPEPVVADDDELGRELARGEVGGNQVPGPLRFGVVREGVLGREAVAEEGHDGDQREDDRGHPGDDRSPWMEGGGASKPLSHAEGSYHSLTTLVKAVDLPTPRSS